MTKLISNFQARSLNALSEHAITSFQTDDTSHPIHTRRLYIKCEETRQYALIEGVGSIIKREQLECSSIGGLSVALNRGWWRLRVSHKHSAIVARCAGHNYATCMDAVEHLRCRLLSFGLKLPTQTSFLWH